MDCLGPGGTRCISLNSAAEHLPLIGVKKVSPGEYDCLSAAESAKRLSEHSPRKDVIKAERFQGIQEYDVQIPSDAAVLKCVVQHNHLAIELLDRHLRGLDPVRVLDVRHVGQTLFQFEGLVIERPGLARRNRDLR